MVGKNYRLQDIQLSKNVEAAAGVLLPGVQPNRAPRRGGLPSNPVGVFPSAGTSYLMRFARPLQAEARRIGLSRQDSRPGLRAIAVAVRRTGRERPTGGEYRARTGDLLVANQALSQLS